MQKYLKKNITRLITSLFTENKVEIGNANKNNIRCLKLNENFYKVDFNSNELIDKAIKTLNDNLIISKMKAKITECEQRSTMSISQLELENSMVVKKIRNEVFNNFVHINTKYDLIGSIATENGLTRHTIIEILKNIRHDVFEQFKYNHEEFIRKASNLINDEKAITILDGITYDKINERFDDQIFTENNLIGKLGINAFESKRHIYDYVIRDSSAEMEFAKNLEN